MTHDQELRKLALELAIQTCGFNSLDGVLPTARAYYEFLTNKETSK